MSPFSSPLARERERGKISRVTGIEIESGEDAIQRPQIAAAPTKIAGDDQSAKNRISMDLPSPIGGGKRRQLGR